MENLDNNHRKSRNVAILLGLFIGTLGVDRFYLGFWGKGILKLVTLGGLGVWAILDVIRLMRNSDFKDAEGHSLDLGSRSRSGDASGKSRNNLLLLSYGLGFLGADRFYLGRNLTGILKLVTLGGVFIWALIDLVMFTLNTDVKDSNGKLLDIDKQGSMLFAVLPFIIGFVIPIILVFIGAFMSLDEETSNSDVTTLTTNQDIIPSTIDESDELTIYEKRVLFYEVLKLSGYRQVLEASELVCEATEGFQGYNYNLISITVNNEDSIPQAVKNWFASQSGIFNQYNFYRFYSNYAANVIVDEARIGDALEGDTEGYDWLHTAISSDIQKVCTNIMTIDEIMAS